LSKIKNQFFEQMVSEDNPFPSIWNYILKKIWQFRPKLEDYYKQEEKMRGFEGFLVNTYDELYSEVLPKYCTGKKLGLEGSSPALFLDSLSLREGILLAKSLNDNGYDTSLTYSFSALPSVTKSFKEEVNFNDLSKNNSSAVIHDPQDISLTGDERLIWSDFPDARLESLAKGKTVLGAITEAYEEVEELLFTVIDQLGPRKLIISSDHGYVRQQGAYSFSMSSHDKKKVRDLLGGGRYISEDKSSNIPKGMENYVVSYNGYHMAKSRYVWPVSGKYNTFQHGGVSLMECLVPVLEITEE